MTNQQATLFGTMIVAALFVLFAVALFQEAQPVSASAPSGLPASMATTSANLVTPNSANVSNIVFATSTCASRIITSYGSDLKITFTDAKGFGPTATQGFIQASSTTVVYDSGQYGCGSLRVYSTATSTITVGESQ